MPAGIYTAPLIRQQSCSITDDCLNGSQHFYGQGILTVSEDGTQSLTIGVENWSLYDVFIYRNQEHASEESIYFPTGVLNSDNASSITYFNELYSSSPERFTDDVNAWYKYTDNANQKFGYFSSVEVNEELDVAYVTFEIEDYQKALAFCTWTNAYNDTLKSYVSTIALHLDTNNLVQVNDMLNAENISDWSYALRLASGRSNSTKKAEFTSRMNVSFTGNAIAKSVFDGVSIEKQADGTYFVKYHVNDSDTSTTYGEFKTLKKVTHTATPYSTSYKEWDLLVTGEFENLSISEDGYISVVYDTLTDAWLGKYIFFDNQNTTDSNVYYCMPCLTTIPNEEFTLIDETTGIYVKTNTSVYPKTTKELLKFKLNIWKKYKVRIIRIIIGITAVLL